MPSGASSEAGIGRALAESDGAQRLLRARQLLACFYGDETREERPWGQQRRTDNNAKQEGLGRPWLLAS